MKWDRPWGAFVCTSAFLLALVCANLACGDTIIKLDLGNDPLSDIQYNGTVLSTALDANGLTTGNQNTSVAFLNFLGIVPQIPTPVASFTLSGVTKSGAATVLAFPNLVIQPFTGGNLSLYDSSNALLLSATLGSSALSGPVGPPATGALFTTTLGTVTGGSLAGMISPNTISMSMSMTGINGGAGFTVTSSNLNSFTADVTLDIAADPLAIPEPATAAMGLVGGLLFTYAFRRRA